MEAEGQFQKRMQEEGGPRASDYLLVEDNGAEVTIIAFAGIAVLYAGMPQFEFHRMLKRIGIPTNLIMVRDIQRSAYCLTPDGKPNGTVFYENMIHSALKQLNSKYNVAMGASAGGAAAFYFSGRLPIDHIITFSPGFPAEIYTNYKTRLMVLGNMKQLFREPGAYAEVLLVTYGATLFDRRIKRLSNGAGAVDVLKGYLSAKPAPARVSLFYGEDCIPDRNQADMMRPYDTVHLRPLPTGRHNCASFLHKQGKLISTLKEEVVLGMQAQAPPHVATPADPLLQTLHTAHGQGTL